MDTNRPAPTVAPDTGVSAVRSSIGLMIMLPLLVALIAVISVLYITHTTSRVQGPSMEPTLLTEDIVLVTRGYDHPLRGDVVVMDAPSHPMLDPGTVLVKRVIAIAGDTIEVRGGRAIVNGQPEHGAYTVYVAAMDIELAPYAVPDGQIFVLGDNRPLSEDSRIFGPASVGLVQGRVVAIIAPVNRAGFVD